MSRWWFIKKFGKWQFLARQFRRRHVTVSVAKKACVNTYFGSTSNNKSYIFTLAADTKTKAKLQQLDLMLKKARLDKTKNQNGDIDGDITATQVYDRNELLRIMKGDD